KISSAKADSHRLKIRRPSQEEAKDAVRTLIAWLGDDPYREGLRDTPLRVVNSYLESFRGYDDNALTALSKNVENAEGYDDIVLLRDIEFSSHCEHHIMPFLGYVH